MKITRIPGYRVQLPLYEIACKLSGGKSVIVFDSTFVRVKTVQQCVRQIRTAIAVPSAQACGARSDEKCGQ